MSETLSVIAIVCSGVALLVVAFQAYFSCVWDDVTRTIESGRHETMMSHKKAIESLRDRVDRICVALGMVDGQFTSAEMQELKAGAIATDRDLQAVADDLDDLRRGLAGLAPSEEDDSAADDA